METARKPEVLGRSFRLREGDIAFSNGDIEMVSGRTNLLQGLGVAIDTPAGSDLFNIVYGFDLANVLVKPEGIGLIRELIRLNIVKSLALDDRVLEVREVVFDHDPRFFELIIDADPKESRDTHRRERRWRAAVVISTISEGELTLELKGPGL